jgi:hypothetical protein
MRYYLVIVLTLVFFACENKESLPDLDGVYVGTYTRHDSIAVISLTIEDYRFVGTSDDSKFISICEGTVGWDDYTIEFDDECLYTAELGWTKFLSGKYSYAYSNKKLSFWVGVGDEREIFTIEELKD